MNKDVMEKKMRNGKLQGAVKMWRRKLSPGKPNGNGAPAAADADAPYMHHYRRQGIPRQLHYPATSISQLLQQSARRFASAPAVIYGDLRWTYGQLHQIVNRLAAALATMGIEPGDRVLLTLPNCPEYISSFLAIQKLGAVVVNAGPLMGSDDLGQLIALTRPRLAISLDLHGPILDRACEGHPNINLLWVSLKNYQTIWKRMGYRVKLWQSAKHAAEPAREASFDELLATASSRPPTVAPDPHDLAVLQPTGGTTGTLKVAQLSHHNLISNAVQISVWGRLRPAQERVLGILPMFHVFGLSTCLSTAIYNAAAMLPLTRFHTHQVLKTIVQHRPTVLPLAPVIVEALCDELELEPNPLACQVFERAMVISGAAPLLPETSKRFERITGIRICQGYGLTEASPVTHANPIPPRHEGSIGVPLPDTLVRVADLQDPAKNADPGAAGEMWIAGPQIMQGYYQNPQETQRVLHTDKDNRRWLRTGDVVRVDEEGYFSVIDRRKDMINRGGLKVWPAKVEQVLIRHPRVTDAAVVGRADPVHTEVVVAMITPDTPVSDPTQLTSELRALCRKHLAHYEVPAHFEFVEQLPRTPLGKLQRQRLRENSHGRNGAPEPGPDHGEPTNGPNGRTETVEQEIS